MRLYPPDILYPYAIDDDSTLFKVFNTAESTLEYDNQAWSTEIYVTPVGPTANEIWAENGFINISGELIYYDLVEKDVHGKICKFKRCLRNFGGSHTQFNQAGTPVRGFVVAEVHNRVADTLIAVESFVGENFSTNQTTLDWRVRNLANTPAIVDDFGCPIITFITEITSQDNVLGTTLSYTIDIIGSIDTFLLQFGDGFSTTSTQPGTHTYAPNATIDPVITATTGNCTISQTAIERTAQGSPSIPTNNNIVDIAIPTAPNIGDINLNMVPTDFSMPIIPINFPCLNLGISSFNIPSVINVTPPIPSVIDMPSTIQVIGGFTLPSTISVIGGFNIPSKVSFVGAPSIPSLINFGNVPSIPDVQFATPFFPMVQFAPVDFPAIPVLIPDIPPITFGSPPAVSVTWGSPPTLSCNVTITCPSTSAASLAEWQRNYLEEADVEDDISANVDYNFAGIPSEIKIVPANIPAFIHLEHNLPNNINVIAPRINDIQINASGIPREINLIAPGSIRLEGVENIPSVIKLEVPDVISFAQVNIPSIISIDGSSIPREINVTGIPESITLKHDLPEFIQLRMPDNPVIEIAPISVVVQMDMKKIMTDNEGNQQCVMIVPCGNS